MFNRQLAFIPLTFALLLMNPAQPEKQTEAIDECSGVAQEQLEAIAAEIAQDHEPAIVTEYLQYYCQGYQTAQENEGIGIGVFIWDEDDRPANLFSRAFGRGVMDAQRRQQ